MKTKKPTFRRAAGAPKPAEPAEPPKAEAKPFTEYETGQKPVARIQHNQTQPLVTSHLKSYTVGPKKLKF